MELFHPLNTTSNKIYLEVAFLGIIWNIMSPLWTPKLGEDSKESAKCPKLQCLPILQPKKNVLETNCSYNFLAFWVVKVEVVFKSSCGRLQVVLTLKVDAKNRQLHKLTKRGNSSIVVDQVPLLTLWKQRILYLTIFPC